jgi:hypothetical protein
MLKLTCTDEAKALVSFSSTVTTFVQMVAHVP